MSNLVESKAIFQQIINVNKLQTKEELDVAREFIYLNGFALKKDITEYLQKNEWSQDPETTLAKLLEYHQVNGGLIGLAEGLVERATYIYYKHYTDNPGADGKRVAQGDKKVFADGEVSDLKGLKKDFEETGRNLWERIQFFKSTRK
jgi:hypothetical protein